MHIDTVIYCWQHYIIISYASFLFLEDWKSIFTYIYGLRYFPFRVSDSVISFLESVWNSPVFMLDNKKEKREMILLGMVFVSALVFGLTFLKGGAHFITKERSQICSMLTFINLAMARHERMYGAPSHHKVD